MRISLALFLGFNVRTAKKTLFIMIPLLAGGIEQVKKDLRKAKLFTSISEVDLFYSNSEKSLPKNLER
jgi:hypothetical protein